MRYRWKVVFLLLSIFAMLLVGCVQSPSLGSEIFPFLSERHAYDKTESFLKSTFPEMEFEIKEIVYDKKWDQFIVSVLGKNGVEFSVDIYRNGSLTSNYVRNKIEVTAIEEIKLALNETIIDAKINVTSYLTESQTKDGSLSFERNGMYMYLVYIRWEEKNLSKEEFVEAVIKIRDKLEKDGFYGANLFISCKTPKDTFTVMLNREDGSFGYTKEQIVDLI